MLPNGEGSPAGSPAGEYRGGLYIAASCRRLFNAASEIAVAVDTDSYHTDFLPFII